MKLSRKYVHYFAAISLIVGAAAFTYPRVADFCRTDQVSIAAALKARQRDSAFNALYAAAKELERHGAHVDHFKMRSLGRNPFQHIDLSGWHGDDAALRPLATFSRLTETGTLSSLHIRLGPSVSENVVGILSGLPNLRTLDINGAMIRPEDLASLRSTNSKLRITEDVNRDSIDEVDG